MRTSGASERDRTADFQIHNLIGGHFETITYLHISLDSSILSALAALFRFLQPANTVTYNDLPGHAFCDQKSATLIFGLFLDHKFLRRLNFSYLILCSELGKA
ncbi:uncharacterized protein METZ01_LOCUS363529 [marine metagenome]|uniref:Uncharacterized protein n=1 Tax=marine metagenome TaxID=408172 RepID=A0A382SMI1_9ZZZZ